MSKIRSISTGQAVTFEFIDDPNQPLRVVGCREKNPNIWWPRVAYLFVLFAFALTVASQTLPRVIPVILSGGVLLSYLWTIRRVSGGWTLRFGSARYFEIRKTDKSLIVEERSRRPIIYEYELKKISAKKHERGSGVFLFHDELPPDSPFMVVPFRSAQGASRFVEWIRMTT